MIINSTSNGQLICCKNHETYQIEFGNIFMKLTKKELQQFTNYVMGIDSDYYLKKNQYAYNNRKLMLHVGSEKLFFSIHESELQELRELLSPPATNNLYLYTSKIEIDIHMN